MAEQNKNVIDSTAKEVTEESKVKVPFPEAHPVAWRRIKKVLKIVAAGGAIFGSVCAAETFKDRRRVYYTLTVSTDDDHTEVVDETDAPVTESASAVFTE